MAYTTQYIGSRYVPLFAEPAEWNSTRTYEPLTIVMHDGNSYTSRQYVPVGIDITNEKFWALTGNYNAQVEAYRQEVRNLLPYDDSPTDGSTKAVKSDGIKKAISDETTRAKNAEQTNATAISDETTRAKNAEQTNATAISDEITRATNAENNNAAEIAKVITFFPENIINVKNFGAVGDGVTDDTKAFKDAIDALKAKLDTTFFTNGQKMFVFEIPNGTYNITSSITFPALGSAESTVSLTAGIFINGNCSTLLMNANDINFDGGYFIIENLSVKNAKNAFNFTHKFSPYVYISNVNVFSSVNGFSFAGTYLCELNKCFVNASNTAYSFTESGTSTTLICCYALGAENGYVFDHYIYSSLINCACDGATNPYVLTECNIKLQNCGAEMHKNYAVQINGADSNIEIESFVSANGNTGIFKNNSNAIPYINNTQIFGTNAKTIPIFTGNNTSSIQSNTYKGTLIANHNSNEYNIGIATHVSDYFYLLSGQLENTESEFTFMNVPSQGFYVITVYGGQDIKISDKFIIYVQYSTLSVISSPTTNRYFVKRSTKNPNNFIITRDTNASSNITVAVERIGSGYTTINNS